MNDDLSSAVQAMRVLWLEDDATLRRAFGCIAADFGARVDMVADHAEALEHLRLQSYDWVITDYRIRGRPSHGFVRDLVREGQQVVVVTGDATLVPRSLGVHVFQKPVRVETVLDWLAAESQAE